MLFGSHYNMRTISFGKVDYLIISIVSPHVIFSTPLSLNCLIMLSFISMYLDDLSQLFHYLIPSQKIRLSWSIRIIMIELRGSLLNTLTFPKFTFPTSICTIHGRNQKVKCSFAGFEMFNFIIFHFYPSEHQHSKVLILPLPISDEEEGYWMEIRGFFRLFTSIN